MRLRSDPEVAAWLLKADGDLRLAQLAMEIESPLWDQTCFHSQQAAEKSLKALLVALERPVPRTHDLFLLVEILSSVFPEITKFTEDASLLTQYGVGPRYPSFLSDEGPEDATQALSASQSMHDYVLTLFE